MGEIFRRAKLFVGRNFRRAKLFVGRNFRHFSKNSSLSPDKLSPDKVPYMVRTDICGNFWTYPEIAEILASSQDQVLSTYVQVTYLGSVCIPYAIVDEELIDEMNITM